MIKILIVLCLAIFASAQRSKPASGGGGGGSTKTDPNDKMDTVIIPSPYDTPVPTGAIDDLNTDPCLILTKERQCKKCAQGFVRMFAVSGIYCAILDVKAKTCTPSQFDTQNRVA